MDLFTKLYRYLKDILYFPYFLIWRIHTKTWIKKIQIYIHTYINFSNCSKFHNNKDLIARFSLSSHPKVTSSSSLVRIKHDSKSPMKTFIPADFTSSRLLLFHRVTRREWTSDSDRFALLSPSSLEDNPSGEETTHGSWFPTVPSLSNVLNCWQPRCYVTGIRRFTLQQRCWTRRTRQGEIALNLEIELKSKSCSLLGERS